MSTKAEELRLCVLCIHYQEPGSCLHPSAISLVTGAPGDCRMERQENTDEFPEACGKAGHNWQRKDFTQLPPPEGQGNGPKT